MSLPERPSLEWLRKTAKQTLKELREQSAEAKLADAQLTVARQAGFGSWRELHRHVSLRERGAEFLRLVAAGDAAAVRRQLDKLPELANVRAPHPFWGGRPQPLHVAIEMRQTAVFRLLLDAGADVNGSNEEYEHWSPLMLTLERGLGEMRDELLRRGARVGLVEALMSGDDALVDARLPAGLPSPVPNGGSLLNFARTPHAIDRLLALGISATQADCWNRTPMRALSRLGTAGHALVKHLVACGVPATAEEYARLGDQEAIERLEPATWRDPAVLLAAVDFGHHALAHWLLEQGAPVQARATGQSRQTALHNAAWNGDLAMTKLLVEAGADLAALDEEHCTTPRVFAETAAKIRQDAAAAAVAEYLRQCENPSPPQPANV